MTGMTFPVSGIEALAADAPAAPVSKRMLELLRVAAAESASPQLAVAVTNSASPCVVWANAAMLNLLHVEPEDLIGRALTQHEPGQREFGSRDPGYRDLRAVDLRVVDPQTPEIGADWRSVILDAMEPALATDQPQWHSATARMPDRRIIQVQVKVTGAADGGWIASLRQVSDEVRVAEEAQRESEHRFRALAEYAPVGILASEAGVRVGYVNARFAEITGRERPALLGTRWLNTIHPEDLPGLLESLDEVMAGKPIEATVRIVSASDSQRWAQFRLSPVTTPRRAGGFIGTVEDITARRAWETQLAYQAGHDALTGLANRRNLMETLSELLTSRRTRDHKLAILFCDLDGFKRINDTLGHDAGDRVLIEVAQRLSATARDHDLVARIAGDEFVVVIREIHDIADAEAAAGRQLAALVPAFHVAGQSVRISASIGLALAEDYDDPTSLLRAADRGMYIAKGTGQGTFQSATALGREGISEPTFEPDLPDGR
ncbi:PAS domain S-box-containing protein/diguanylate cyclase (GGDEF)-like protein [Jatrophihabitans sp. GAS493]|uniref:sensor domain-containing diguanylate cyclase n=1 Tax=Jatrophihabitans sp. GAS493 TaxID=1907575 RepID=UPI000BB8188D|nr:sensor domain-containing diguanylate cyclase [Jatrophihabitans sp. GAS493]SOD71407.1 PAS domain S-box-containing protein/diguanylate cyclase (GGDEF)-like protein [Jatrophihabitans sp. GAS493]